MGDPAGIGPDITLAAWASAKAEPTAPFMLLSDPEFMRGRAEILELDMAIEEIAGADDALKVFPKALPVLPVALQGPIVPGQPEAAAVPAILSAIERAVELVYQGEASALVTNPINKKLLYDSGFRSSRPYRISGRACPGARRYGRTGDDAGMRRVEGRAGHDSHSGQGCSSGAERRDCWWRQYG